MRVVGGLMLGLMVLTAPAIAQKPGAVPPATAPGLPTTKPPPLGAVPALPPRVQAPTPPAAPPTPPPAVLALPPPDEAPAIRRLRALFPPDVQMTYRTATVVDEASQRVRLEGVTLRRPDSTVTFDDVTLEGQTDNSVRDADLRGVTINANGTSLSMARLRITGLAIPTTTGGADPRPEDVTLDRLSVEGVRMDSGTDGIYSLAGLVIEDLGTGRRTRVRLENFAGERTTTTANGFSLARAALSGIDVATFIRDMRTAGRAQPQAGRIELTAEGFTFSDGGRPVGSLDSFRLESDTDPTQNGAGRLGLRGFRMDGVPQLAAAIRQLGYQSLVADLTMDATFQGNGGMLGVPALVLSVPEYGRLTFSAEFDRFVPGAAPEAMMANARLVGMILRYRDEGLLARALRAQAAEQRMTEQALREQAIGMARGMLAGPAAAVLREPLERFLRGQASELELTVRPPQPIPIGALSATPPRDAADAQRRFGLTATAR